MEIWRDGRVHCPIAGTWQQRCAAMAVSCRMREWAAACSKPGELTDAAAFMAAVFRGMLADEKALASPCVSSQTGTGF